MPNYAPKDEQNVNFLMNSHKVDTWAILTRVTQQSIEMGVEHAQGAPRREVDNFVEIPKKIRFFLILLL